MGWLSSWSLLIGCVVLLLASQHPRAHEEHVDSLRAELLTRVQRLEVASGPTTCVFSLMRPTQAALLPSVEQAKTGEADLPGLPSRARQLVSLGLFVGIIVLPGSFLMHPRDKPEPRWMRLLHPKTKKSLHAQLVSDRRAEAGWNASA